MAPKEVLTEEQKAERRQVELQRRRLVGVNSETVTDVGSTDYPGHYPGEDHAWHVDRFRNAFNVVIHENKPLEACFSLIGLDASVANAFRRIMIAEIETLAIETVFMNNNTSIIQDEVLASRIGLVPFKGGKKGLREYLTWYNGASKEGDGGAPAEFEREADEATDQNTIMFELKVECTRNTEAKRGTTNPLHLYHNAHVYAKDIKFKPFGQQAEFFSGENAMVPTNPDILLAKMRPGQCIDAVLHAVKGVGSDHSKFSPVATASYRLMPVIDIRTPILGQDAVKFQGCFPEGVVELKKITRKEAKEAGDENVNRALEEAKGDKVAETSLLVKAVVVDAMKDTVSRECLRHDEFANKVKLGRIRDHFIFSVESLGQWDSDELFLESVKTLRKKCEVLKRNLNSVPGAGI